MGKKGPIPAHCQMGYFLRIWYALACPKYADWWMMLNLGRDGCSCFILGWWSQVKQLLSWTFRWSDFVQCWALFVMVIEVDHMVIMLDSMVATVLRTQMMHAVWKHIAFHPEIGDRLKTQNPRIHSSSGSFCFSGNSGAHGIGVLLDVYFRFVLKGWDPTTRILQP